MGHGGLGPGDEGLGLGAASSSDGLVGVSAWAAGSPVKAHFGDPVDAEAPHPAALWQ